MKLEAVNTLKKVVRITVDNPGSYVTISIPDIQGPALSIPSIIYDKIEYVERTKFEF